MRGRVEVPDYTYHPFLKHLLFRMPAEESRRLTLGLLEYQSRTAIGRRIFRFFGHGLPPKNLSVDIFGMHFPGPVGLAGGIDIEASSLMVMQYLGFGFITVGPAGCETVPRNFSTDPLRLADRHALVLSGNCGAPSVEELSNCIVGASDLRIPAGVALRGENLESAIAQAANGPAFFTL